MSSAQTIGGYFELELPRYGSFFHNNAIALNSGRNAFGYILETLEVKRVYLPLYICPVVLQPLRRLKIDYAFYSINENLEPDQCFAIGDDEYLLYVNYFGLKNTAIRQLSEKYTNTIIDNAQAFFDFPASKTLSFYSPRKFFGVPDGGFAYIDESTMISLRQDKTSFERCLHLLKRSDLGPSEGFSDFQSNENEFENRPMARMSKLTRKILESIDYAVVRNTRNKNFYELHTALRKTNQLSHVINKSTINGPMAYPYLSNDPKIREYLRFNKIFTPTYWPGLSEISSSVNTFESHLAEHLIPLPVDQRYGLKDMDRIISVIEEYNE